MDSPTFAYLALIGVPVFGIAMLFVGHWLLPKRVWFSFQVQTLVTGWFFATVATPFLVVWKDSEGDYFEDERALVTQAFALPPGTSIDRQGDRTLRTGDCWRNAVNWRSEITFPSQAAFNEWVARNDYKAGIVEQLAGYHGIEPGDITVEPGALDMRERDPKYQLRDGHKSYRHNVRVIEFYRPFVCAAIERSGDDAFTLRPCDPLAQEPDVGNAGIVVINPNAGNRDGKLEGRIYYAGGPHYCTNPVRKQVNDALGLPHPMDDTPNTRMGGTMPL